MADEDIEKVKEDLQVIEELPVYIDSSDEEDKISVLTEYNSKEFFSTAVRSKNGTIPLDIFEFIHSFSYDCQRYYNLCACDENVVAWCAGSIVTFYNVITNEVTFRRSTTGGTVGHIAKNPHPELSHIAIAEGGFEWVTPIIIIYEWPSMKMQAVLRDGTVRSFAKIDYSPDGNLIASIGGAPDYSLTIFDWRRHRIVLRTNAFTFNVNNVQFSPYIPGQLTTSGMAHIKFWKMAPTFTGLKLIGELGRFGKTEICDILGVWPMPDEKVISGCSWGNILVWENGLVKMEVCRKGRRPCHQGAITQFLRYAETAEVTSVGLDGHICVWFWETVEQFDPPENDPVMELNPVSEVYVSGAQFMSISRRRDQEWFAQDATGAIWSLNLGTEEGAGSAEELTGKNAQRLVRTHGGAVVGLAALRSSPLLLSLGCDGSLLLHGSPRGPLMVAAPSRGPASSMLYLPDEVDSTGCTVLIGYNDGTMRVIFLDTAPLEHFQKLIEDDSCTLCIQTLKPHAEPVIVISIAPGGSLLLTGSLDSTLFLYKVQTEQPHLNLVPMAYIPTPQPIHYICWKPGQELIVLLSGAKGLIMEAELPHIDTPPVFEEITTYIQNFVSVKISILRDLELRMEPPDEVEEKTDALLSSSDDEVDDDDIFPPEIEIVAGDYSTKTILWASYEPATNVEEKAVEGVVWAAQECCGSLLRLRPGGNIDAFLPLPGFWSAGLHSHFYLWEDKYLVLGSSEGNICIVRRPKIIEIMNAEDDFVRRMRRRARKLKKKKGRKRGPEPELIIRIDIVDYLTLPMHDCNNGAITQMFFSKDNKYFFTAGGDGNIFSYYFNFDPELIPKYSSILFTAHPNLPEVVGMEAPEYSHEQMARERERRELLAIAAAHKQAVQDRLAQLAIQLRVLLKKNRSLPLSQQVRMEADPRVLERANQDLEDQMNLVHRKLAFPLAVSSLRLEKMLRRNVEPLDVFPFRLLSIENPGFGVNIIRQKKLTDKFFDDVEAVKKSIADEAAKARRSIQEEITSSGERRTIIGVEAPLLQALPPHPPPTRSLARALRDYLHRLERFDTQERERQEHAALLVDEPDDAVGGVAWALRQAEATIGAYQFKSQPQENAPLQPPLLTQLLIFTTRQEIYEIQHEFNKSLLKLRARKSALAEHFAHLIERVTDIEEELKAVLPHSTHVHRITINPVIEYPERELEVKEDEENFNRQISRRKQFTIQADAKRLSFSERPIIRETNQFKDVRENFWEKVKKDPDQFKFTTPWEREMKEVRTISLMMKHSDMLSEMNASVREWEQDLQDLGRTRSRVMLRSQYLRLHLLRLTQEHQVLDSFYSRETTLADNVQSQQALVREKNDRVRALQKATDAARQEVLALQERCRQLEVQQRRLAANTRFDTFLHRVYRKKHKPPKLDDESTESSSSEEEEEEEESEEEGSEEAGATRVRLDSTACPPGLDPQLWEETLLLREIKYGIENDVKEQEKQVEAAKREIENCQKEAKLLVIDLQEKQQILREVIFEKQTKLNDIDALVVLQADQCGAEALNMLCKEKGVALVFPAPAVFSLRSRINELIHEAEEQKKRHLINKQHLKRMAADSEYMSGRVADLQAACSRAGMAKLAKAGKGGERAAAQLLDAVLSDMGQSFKRAASGGLTVDMLEQASHWAARIPVLERQYCALLHEHTEKLRVAATLEAEVYNTKRGEAKETMALWAGGRTEAEYRTDLVRLKRLRQKQNQQIEELRSEVQKLRIGPGTGGGPPPAFTPDPRSATPRTTSRLPTPDSSIAAKLAQSLRNAGLTLDAAADAASLNEIVRVLPLLITGKIDSTEAADRVMKKIGMKEAGVAPRQELAHSLSRMTRLSVVLGEVPKRGRGWGRGAHGPVASQSQAQGQGQGAVEATLRGLLEASVGTVVDEGAVDFAVAALLEVVPQAAAWPLPQAELCRKLLGDGEYGPELVHNLVRAMAECLAAQRPQSSDAVSVAVSVAASLPTSATANDPPHGGDNITMIPFNPPPSRNIS